MAISRLLHRGTLGCEKGRSGGESKHAPACSLQSMDCPACHLTQRLNSLFGTCPMSVKKTTSFSNGSVIWTQGKLGFENVSSDCCMHVGLHISKQQMTVSVVFELPINQMMQLYN